MTDKELQESTEKLYAEQEALQAEMEELRTKYQNKAKLVFKELTKAVFKLVPDIKTISWQQFIPSFNDGDACTFTLYDVYFSNATTQQIEDNGEGYNEDAFYNNDEGLYFDSPSYGMDESGLSKQEIAALKRFSRFVTSNEDLMQDLFGDNAQIVITEEGVSVEDYDPGY